MATVSIRRYKNLDYDKVRLLFAEGMQSLTPNVFRYFLKIPHVHFVLLTMFLIVLSLTRSYLQSLTCVSLVVACGYYLVKAMISNYVSKCQKEDLLDIEKSYMTGKKSCFWVAETNGNVVGIVGVQPAKDSEDAMVLRRLSVAKSQRGQGVARSLCQMVIDFAREHGVTHVNLDTSIMQESAYRLYENMGFKKTRVRFLQTPLGRFGNLCIMYYTYNVK